jgi:hypothetical protein
LEKYSFIEEITFLNKRVLKINSEEENFKLEIIDTHTPNDIIIKFKLKNINVLK